MCVHPHLRVSTTTIILTPDAIVAYCFFFFIPKLIVLFHFTQNRWGNTPLDEARMSGNKNLIKLLEDAKSAQLTEFPFPQEITGTDMLQ